MEYNIQQQNALENNLHQLLIANAGSGKTAVLVEKFYRLIAERPLDEIQRVVAITFTRKAASEMRERIVQTLNQQIENIGNVDKNDVYMKLVMMRERISSAKIQTIHSFCQEILSENAVNIGYNPNFSVIEEYQFKKIYIEYFDDTLEDVMELDENYKFIFEVISESKFNEMVKMLVDNSILLNEVEGFYNQSNEEIMEEIFTGYIEIITDFLDKNKDSIHSNTNLFSPKNQDKIEILFNILAQLDLHISKKDLHQLYILLSDLKKLKYVGNSLYIKAVLSNQEYQFVGNLLKELESLTKSKNNDNIVVFFELMRNIVSFARSLYQKIEYYKRRNSLITYNDMIYKVIELLENEEIVAKLSEKYDYFLIDEFQDTDAKQFEIFQKLAFSLGKTHKFLFLVGDPKQSIYGFRNADVRVINSASKLMEEKNKELIKYSDQNPKAAFHSIITEQNFGKLELSSSYRLNVANAAFVNHIFSKLMTNSSSTGFEVDYNHLNYSRYNPYFNTNTKMLSPYLSELFKYGSVKFLNTIILEQNPEKNNEQSTENESEENTNQNETINKERDNLDEANSVSDYIKYIINNKVQIYDTKLKAERKLIFSDIAILVRKNSLINNLVKALDRNGIPFNLTGAEDFFETQEIIDILSFLRFIHNPNDNFYFMSVLKSYFFNLEDQVIYDIISNDSINSGSFWNIFLEHTNKKENINPKVNRAQSILNEIFIKKEFYTVKDLVTYILRITNYEEMFVNFPSKNIIYKNINKFKTLVDRICSTGINSVGELLYELELVQESSEISSELEISPENAVNILTMHKAKGLEFPVVLIYHANFSTNLQTRLTFFNNKFPNIKYNILANSREEATSPLYSFIKKRQQLIEYEEEKRLFYVAATRAKDLLIISSLIKKDKDGDYSKSMSKGFGPFYFPILYKNHLENGKFVFTLDFKEDKNNELGPDNLSNFEKDQIIEILENLDVSLPNQNIRSQPVTIPIEILNNFRFEQDLDYSEERKTIEPILLVEDVEFPNQDQHISATKIQQFLKNKKEYFLKYIVGFNLDYLELLEEEATNFKEGLRGKERGTIIHNTIANIHNWCQSGNINSESLRLEISKHLNRQVQPEIIDDIEEEIVRVFSTEFIKDRIDNILKSKLEIPFYYYWDGRYVDIVLDLLYQDENGNYEIWDWKNNKINSDDEYTAKVDYYSLQMKFYSLILSKQNMEQNRFVARLLFTRLAGKDERWMKVFEWNRDELIEFENEMKVISDEMYNIKSISFD